MLAVHEAVYGLVVARTRLRPVKEEQCAGAFLLSIGDLVRNIVEHANECANKSEHAVCDGGGSAYLSLFAVRGMSVRNMCQYQEQDVLAAMTKLTALGIRFQGFGTNS